MLSAGNAVAATGPLAAYKPPIGWFEFKNYLSQVTHLQQDALHIYAAVLIQFAVAIVLRRSLASTIPWLCMIALLLINELFDLSEPGKPIELWQVLGGVHDIWNTIALPTVLLLAARFAPSLLTGKRRSAN